MRNILKNRMLTNILLICLLALISIGAAQEYKRITNLRVKGWLFGDKDRWVGWHTISAQGANDTFCVAGVDTFDYMFVSLRTDSLLLPIRGQIWKKDSVVINCPEGLSHDTDKVNWLIIKK